MANRFKGEVDVQALDRTWTFRLGVNEMIALQDALGIKDDENFLRNIADLKTLKQVRLVVKHALLCKQPDITEEMAGELISEIGPEQIGETIKKAVLWALPDPEPAGDAPSGKDAAASAGVMPS